MEAAEDPRATAFQKAGARIGERNEHKVVGAGTLVPPVARVRQRHRGRQGWRSATCTTNPDRGPARRLSATRAADPAGAWSVRASATQGEPLEGLVRRGG